MHTNNRLYNLDYLRGVAAFGIMIYHYLSWTRGTFSADSFMGRVGIYGVSIFYVLSGLTLFHVYYDKIKFSREDIASFFKKRIFRIFPLLWLVTIAAIVLSRKAPDFYDLFLNLTGLFGFVRWDTYFAVGAWSIGNELVFYAFFPFFILFAKSHKPWMIVLSVVVFALYVYFAFIKLTPDLTLTQQWKNYTNPLNQVFLFLGGFLIGLLTRTMHTGNVKIFLLLFLAIGVFAFYPVPGDRINLVTGLTRLIFTACCFLICFCFYKMILKLPAFVHSPLSILGEASYSVYLLHPLVFTVSKVGLTFFSKRVFSLPAFVTIVVPVILTLMVSYFVYQYFEKYFMKLGRTNKSSIA